MNWMATEYTERLDLDSYYSLSFLFNSFIWMQIFNEINCRRIKVRLTVLPAVPFNFLL